MGIGLAAGTIATVFAARILSSQLYEVAATDPRVFLATAGVVFTTTLVSGLIPARRASRVDPMVALRAD
jgi:ABC-type antimicrobial peptide transport system permease subunit